MNQRLIRFAALLVIAIGCLPTSFAEKIRIGIIGLDTPHASSFAEIINKSEAAPELSKCEVVAALDYFSPDNADSVKYHKSVPQKIQELGIEIVDDMPTLLDKVDAVLVESIDGRPHLEQILPIVKAGKPVFVDKPVAASLAEVIAIYKAAEKNDTPVFSSSALRYGEKLIAALNELGQPVDGCDSYSPCPIDANHPDLYWYGIHGVEILFTAMGPDCESVVRVHTDNTDLVVGNWKDGRVGSFRGRRIPNNGYLGGFGGTAFSSKGIKTLGSFDGYEPLVVEIAKFFQSGKSPVSPEETIAIYAFMEAADQSKQNNGSRVLIEDVIESAEMAANKLLQQK